MAVERVVDWRSGLDYVGIFQQCLLCHHNLWWILHQFGLLLRNHGLRLFLLQLWGLELLLGWILLAHCFYLSWVLLECESSRLLAWVSTHVWHHGLSKHVWHLLLSQKLLHHHLLLLQLFHCGHLLLQIECYYILLGHHSLVRSRWGSRL